MLLPGTTKDKTVKQKVDFKIVFVAFQTIVGFVQYLVFKPIFLVA